MANIGLILHSDARIKVSHFRAENPCIGIDIAVDLPAAYEGGAPIPFARDSIMLHGNATQLRAFAESIIAAVSKGTVADATPQAEVQS